MVVFLDATRTRTGIGLTRADAVLDAELAIDKVLDSRQRNAKETSSMLGAILKGDKWNVLVSV